MMHWESCGYLDLVFITSIEHLKMVLTLSTDKYWKNGFTKRVSRGAGSFWKQFESLKLTTCLPAWDVLFNLFISQNEEVTVPLPEKKLVYARSVFDSGHHEPIGPSNPVLKQQKTYSLKVLCLKPKFPPFRPIYKSARNRCNNMDVDTLFAWSVI